ncbi:glycosyltransferase family 2 protein, partial [Calditerrivibrio sp.]|uniref:glycosyltransferase family 2 protein n=1 Tax=Calditerrivibrio sp. TaxID=2792612 RepID=UPI003D0F069A
NNDTVIENDLIKKTMEAKLNFGEKAIYGARILYYWNPTIIWYDGGRFNEWTGRSVHLNMGKRLDQVENCSIKEVNFITFCYVVLPKFIIKNIGLLDESYFMYVEDLDYSYRVWKAGYKLYHVCNTVLYHKVGASNNGEVSEFSAYWGMKNRLKFIFHNLTFTKKVFSVLFIISSRIIKLPIFFFKNKVRL